MHGQSSDCKEASSQTKQMSRDGKRAPPPPARKESPTPARKDSGATFSFRKSSAPPLPPNLAKTTPNSPPRSPKAATEDVPILRPAAPSDVPMLRPSNSNDFATLKTTRSPSSLFPQAMEQFEANFSFLCRVISHIKKVVATREVFAAALAKEWALPPPKSNKPMNTPKKATLTQPLRAPPLPAFSATKSKNMFPSLLQRMEAIAELETSQVGNFCVQCKVAVLTPLEKLRDKLDEGKKKAEREEKERRLKFDEVKLRDELHRRKQRCLALWMNLQGMHKNRVEARKILKFLVVIERKFTKYQNMVNSFNAMCDSYYSVLPPLIQTLTMLENERVDTMRNVLQQYCLLWQQLYSEPAKEAEAMLGLLAETSGSEQKEPPALETIEVPIVSFDLPCSPEELAPGFGTDPTRGPYVHKFDTTLKAVLQAHLKENLGRKISMDEARVDRRFSRFDKSDEEAEAKQEPEPEHEEKTGTDDGTQGDVALAIYKQMFGCEPGELGHPILVEDESEEEASTEEDDDD